MSASGMASVPTSEERSKIIADFAAKRLLEVSTAASALTEQYPDHEFGWRALGAALYLKGDIAGALKATERAVMLAPSPDSRCNLARIYLHEKKYLLALEQCEAALQEAPEYADAHALMGELSTLSEDSDAAIKSYQECISRNPQDVSAHFGLALEEMHRGNLPTAVARFRYVLTLGLEQPWFDIPLASPKPFDAPASIRLFRQTLVSLASSGVQAFATSGTLLGLEREGRLLSFDKDLDIGLPMAQMELACECMKAQGWTELSDPLGCVTPRSFKHDKLDLYIDLFGFQMDETTNVLVGGIWSAKLPWEWQRVTEFASPLSLHKERHHYGEIWVLDDPDTWLTTIYGDWRTPNPEFDTLISALNLRGFSLLTESFAFLKINKAWRAGQLKKTLSLVRQTQRHLPEDELLGRVAMKLVPLLAK